MNRQGAIGEMELVLKLPFNDLFHVLYCRAFDIMVFNRRIERHAKGRARRERAAQGTAHILGR